MPSASGDSQKQSGLIHTVVSMNAAELATSNPIATPRETSV